MSAAIEAFRVRFRFILGASHVETRNDGLVDLVGDLLKALEEAQTKAAAFDAINTPEIHNFIVALEREALHQRQRWPADHDAGKTDADWFWLIGYLAGKALHKPEKRLHHIITTAAACLNWHAHALGAHTRMRPGIAPPEESPAGITRVVEIPDRTRPT